MFCEEIPSPHGPPRRPGRGYSRNINLEWGHKAARSVVRRIERETHACQRDDSATVRPTCVNTIGRIAAMSIRSIRRRFTNTSFVSALDLAQSAQLIEVRG